MRKKDSKCIIILSSKSAGSSALQRLLSSSPYVKHIEKTRHFEYETLYWTKAASILGLPQIGMIDSEVPFSQGKAKSDLMEILRENICGFVPPEEDGELIFGGWRSLCQHYKPVFLEKSPHHLYQWSALTLIKECMDRLPEIEFLLIGLIRNPMAVVYSAWDRWGIPPEKYQYEWLTSYSNLIRYKEIVRDKLSLVKYEDIVKDREKLRGVFDFIGAEQGYGAEGKLHGKSVEKWRTDTFFGFNLDEEVIKVGEEVGYERHEMHNSNHALWSVYKRTPHFVRASVKRLQRFGKFVTTSPR